MSLNSLIAATATLQRLEGVSGVMLFKSRHVIHKQMPFSDNRAQDLRQAVWQMMEGYRQVRRRMRQVYLEFDGGTLLVIIQEECILALLLTPRADPDLLASVGCVLFNDHAGLLSGLSGDPAPEPAKAADTVEELVVTSPRRMQQINETAELVVNSWGQVRKCIEGILGKVMGRAQAGNLIDRTMDALHVTDPYRLGTPQVRRLAESIIEHIPNVTKRRQLLTELESRLAEFNL